MKEWINFILNEDPDCVSENFSLYFTEDSFIYLFTIRGGIFGNIEAKKTMLWDYTGFDSNVLMSNCFN